MRMTPRVIVKKLIRRWSISASARCCDRHALTWFMCLSSTGDVLEISVVRGVGGVCDMCMCLARCCVGGEGVSG